MIDRDGDGDISRGEMMKAINQIPSMKALIRRNKYLAPLLNPKRGRIPLEQLMYQVMVK